MEEYQNRNEQGNNIEEPAVNTPQQSDVAAEVQDNKEMGPLQENVNEPARQPGMEASAQPRDGMADVQVPNGTAFNQPQNGQPNAQPQNGMPYGQAPNGTAYDQPQNGMPYGQAPNGAAYNQPQNGMPCGQPQYADTYGPQPGAYQVPPAQTDKNKGAVKAVIIAIVVLAAALTAVGIWLAFSLMGRTPQARLAHGFKLLGEEAASYGNVFNEQLGWDKIAEEMANGAASSKLTMNVTIPELNAITVGVDISNDSDHPNKRSSTGISASVANIELISAQAVTDDQYIYLTVPDLLDETLKADVGSYAESFNASVWSKLLDMTIEEELSDGEDQEDGEMLQFSEQFLLNIAADIKSLADHLSIEAAGTAIEKERNGKTVKCQGYTAVLDKDSLNRILDHIQEELKEGNGRLMAGSMLNDFPGADADSDEYWDQVVAFYDFRFATDINLVFYLDNQDRIVHMATPETFRMEEGNVAFGFSMDLNGSERTLDDIDGMFKVLGDNGSSLSFQVTRDMQMDKKDYTDKVNITMDLYDSELEENYPLYVEYINQWNNAAKDIEMSLAVYDDSMDVRVSMEGGFRDVVKGESLSFELGSLKLSGNQVTVLKLTGSFSVEPLKGEISIPENPLDIFAVSEDEALELVFKISSNLQNLISKYAF